MDMGTEKIFIVIFKEISIRLNCEFIMVPGILFSDEELSKTDINVFGLIISLALKSGYCFASNNFLANYINVSERTITNSLSNLKKLGYILVKDENHNRKIYINDEKIPITSSRGIEENGNTIEESFDTEVEENFEHNINNKYKKEYKNNKFYKSYKKKEIVPEWLRNPELCKSTEPTEKERKEMEELLKEFK